MMAFGQCFTCHPTIRKHIGLWLNRGKTRIIVEEQTYFEDLARRRGLTLVGSYNPANLGLKEDAFFDGSHPTEDGVRKLFAVGYAGRSLANN